jgi:hypothetical protein
MHKAPDLRTEEKPSPPDAATRENTKSFFLDSISAPSASADKPPATRESAAMRLASALAKGGHRLRMRTEAAIQPDLVRQAPPLPPLQPKYLVSPLFVLE